MKRAFYIFLLIAPILLLSACTKYSFMPMHRKVVGTWGFEKVRHRPGLLKGNIDVTKDFSNWEFTFHEHGLVEAHHIHTRESKTGSWQMEEYTDVYYDEDGNGSSTSEHVLRFYLRSSRGVEENYVWNIGSITERRLRASERIGNETFTYVMDRK